MASFFLNLTPDSGCGFCNQLYSIVGTCCHANERNIKYIFISRYLKQIHGNDYCNISDVLDMEKTNKYLKKYDITLIDGYNFRFNIDSVKYGNKVYNIDITEQIVSKFYKNKVLQINSTVDLNNINGDPYKFFKNKFCIDIKGHKTLYITYSINNITFVQEFETVNGLLKTDLNINYRDLTFIKTLKSYNDGTQIFREHVNNFVFNAEIVNSSIEYIKKNIDVTKTINTIHLRLEDDAIQHWGRESKFPDLKLYKSILEQNYIHLIKQLITKDSITILLASDYDNEVVKYLKSNNYNFVTTPKMNPHRDISAIIDMHIGQSCNNVCIGVQESTFSYTLFFRSNPMCKNVILYYTNVQHPGSILTK